MRTRAEARLALSGSEAVRAGSIAVAAPPSVYGVVPAEAPRAGASFTAATFTARVAAALATPAVSVTRNVTSRAAVDGLWVVSENVTDRNADWYAAEFAVPVRESTPVPEL